MTTKVRYHHGDLRRSLVNAAVAILTETQRWDFSLREVARRAGVSHNAPYSHFADKQALLAAVGVAGYVTLRERMLEASTDAPDADAALEAIGQTYVAFGLENPAHYRLMFGQELQADGLLPADLAEAAEASRLVLHDVVQRGAEEAVFNVDPSDPTNVAVAVLTSWSIVHGFTLLAIDGFARLEGSYDAGQMAALVAEQFRRGLVRK